MAATPPGKDDDLELKPATAGVLFRAEMFTSNIVFGYWRGVVAVVIVVLLAVLLYGQYKSYNRRSQRAASSEIAQVMDKLPVPLPELAQQVASGQKVDATALVSTADGLTAVAATVGGTASSEALLHAAELYRLAGEPTKQRAALTEAVGTAKGVLAYAANEGLANLDLAEGKGEEAVARLRKMSEGKDFLAEQATLDLGLALEHLDRGTEAAEVYDQFLTRWPESTHKDDVEEHRARLGGAPPAAPTDGAATPAAPATPETPAAAAPEPAPAGGAG